MEEFNLLNEEELKSEIESFKERFKSLLELYKDEYEIIFQLCILIEEYFIFLNKMKIGSFIESDFNIENITNRLAIKYPFLIEAENLDWTEILSASELNALDIFEKYNIEKDKSIFKSNLYAQKGEDYFFEIIIKSFAIDLSKLVDALKLKNPLALKDVISKLEDFQISANEKPTIDSNNHLGLNNGEEVSEGGKGNNEEISHPFIDEKAYELFLLIHNKHKEKTNIFYTYILIFFEIANIIEEDDPIFKNNYFEWLNKNYKLNSGKKIGPQTNKATSSSKNNKRFNNYKNAYIKIYDKNPF